MIETDRLMIRPFSSDDAGIIYRIYSDEEILKYTPYDRMSMDSAARHLERIIADWKQIPVPGYEMCILLKEGGEKIGRCGIHPDTETASAMIGIMLFKPYWGKGYATETARALITYSFETLQIRRLYALCNPENMASRNVLEKCGMRQEALFKEKRRYIKNGTSSWHDEMEYAILKTEAQS